MIKWNAKLAVVNGGQFELQGSPLHAAGRRWHEGFTLIEVLVSMTIFSIAILGLVIGTSSVMRANQQSYFSTIAINLAQDKLEELKANPTTLLFSCSTSCESPPTHDGVAFIRTWTVTPNSPAPGISQIDAKVDWTNYTSHSVTISSAVLN